MSNDLSPTVVDLLETAIDDKISAAVNGTSGGATSRAQITRIDKDGTVWARLFGSDTETPVAMYYTNYAVGDIVSVLIQDGTATISGNYTSPAVGSNYVGEAVGQAVAYFEQGIEDTEEHFDELLKNYKFEIIGDIENVETQLQPIKNTAESAKALAEEAGAVAKNAGDAAKQAGNLAKEAGDIAKAIDEHFWTDTDGVHVTRDTQATWSTAAKNKFSDLSDSKPYNNLIMTSGGILLRSALNYYASFSRSGVAFYDGKGTAAANVVSSFGANGAQIGKSSANNLVLDSNGILLRSASNYYASFSKSGAAFYDGNGTAAANMVSRFGTDGAQIGKESANNIVLDSSGQFIRNGKTVRAGFTDTAIAFYNKSGKQVAAFTTSDETGNVVLGLADKWRTYLGNSYGLITADTAGTYRMQLNANGFYLRNAKTDTADAVTTAELLANGTMRLGRYAAPHLYVSTTAMSFNIANSNAQGIADSNSWFLVNNSPAVRVGKYADTHIYMNSAGFGINPANVNDATLTGGSYSAFTGGAARIGLYSGSHLFLTGSTMAFALASANPTALQANGSTFFVDGSTPAVRIGKHDGVHGYFTNSSFGVYPSTKYDSNSAYAYIDSNGLRVGPTSGGYTEIRPGYLRQYVDVYVSPSINSASTTHSLQASFTVGQTENKPYLRFGTRSGAYGHTTATVGYANTASGNNSVVIGHSNFSSLWNSLVVGLGNTASTNVSDADSKLVVGSGAANDNNAAFIIGNGDVEITSTSSGDKTVTVNARANSFVVKPTGTIWFPSVGYTYDGNMIGSNNLIQARVYDGKTTKYNRSILRAYYDGTDSGMTLCLDSGGTTVIGAGEYADGFHVNNPKSSNEYLYLGADGHVLIETNANTYGDRRTWRFNNNGAIVCEGNKSLQRDATNMGAQVDQVVIQVNDMHETTAGRLLVRQSTAGQMGINLETYRYNAAGAGVWNTLRVAVNADGTRAYTVSDPTAFRNALGASSGVWTAAMIPNLSTDKLTSGTLPTARGGTGQTSSNAAARAWGLACTAGDSVAGIYWNGGGFLTSARKSIHVSFPLGKRTYGSISKVNLTAGTVIFRQNNGYHFETTATAPLTLKTDGATSNSKITYTAWLRSNSIIQVEFKANREETSGINNDAVGVELSNVTVAFS